MAKGRFNAAERRSGDRQDVTWREPCCRSCAAMSYMQTESDVPYVDDVPDDRCQGCFHIDHSVMAPSLRPEWSPQTGSSVSSMSTRMTLPNPAWTFRQAKSSAENQPSTRYFLVPAKRWTSNKHMSRIVSIECLSLIAVLVRHVTASGL